MSIATALRNYRVAAWVTGIGLLVLVFIAMPLKYFFGEPRPVALVGMMHGFLYMAYIVLHADPRRALPVAAAGRGRDPAGGDDPDRVVRRRAAGHAPGPRGPGGARLRLRHWPSRAASCRAERAARRERPAARAAPRASPRRPGRPAARRGRAAASRPAGAARSGRRPAAGSGRRGSRSARRAGAGRGRRTTSGCDSSRWAQPVVLQPAERVRAGRREVDGRERGAAVAVGEHGRARIAGAPAWLRGRGRAAAGAGGRRRPAAPSGAPPAARAPTASR